MNTNDVPLNDIFQAIDSTDDLGDLPAKYWPVSHTEEYLFISYSHRDYKDVFKDLTLLQREGVNIWYDKSLVPGRDWEAEAEQSISNYHCIGVIFYISMNSLSSASIEREMEYVKKRGKPFFSINLPVGGENLSVRQMYDLLDERYKNERKERLIDELFNDRIIFFPLNMEPSVKKAKIDELFSLPPLFNYMLSPKRFKSNDPDYRPDYLPRAKYSFEISEGYASLTSVNNIDLIHADDVPEVVNLDGDNYFLAKIDNCAFANCRNLEDIELPDSIQLIKSSAFHNCCSLEFIRIPESCIFLGSSVFAGCLSLKHAILPDRLETIRDWTFAGCLSMRTIFIPKGVTKVGPNCFNGDKGITIFAEAPSKPEGWSDDFNPNDAEVVWGSSRKDAGEPRSVPRLRDRPLTNFT